MHTCLIPSHTLTGRTERVFEKPNTILARASGISFPDVCLNGTDSGVQLGGHFLGNWVIIQFLCVSPTHLKQFAGNLVNPHSRYWIMAVRVGHASSTV